MKQRTSWQPPPCTSVAEELREARSRDPSPCRVAGSMVSEPLPLARLAHSLYYDTNLNDTKTYRTLAEMEEWLKEFIQTLLGRRGLEAIVAYGASESILTALYAAREDTKRKTVVAPLSAHESVFKACRILGMRCATVPVDHDLRADPQPLRQAARREKPAAIVVTAGITDNGAIDPVAEAAETAEETGAHLVVDAAYGGIPLAALGRTQELAADHASAIILDPHKALTGPGTSILAIDEHLAKHLYFEAPYMPGGRQKTLLWTRSGASIAAVYATLRCLGPQGLRSLAEHLHSLAEQLTEKLRTEIPVYSKPWTPVVAFNTGRTAEEIAEALRRKHGIILYPSRLPHILRYIPKWCHDTAFVEKLANQILGYKRHSIATA